MDLVTGEEVPSPYPERPDWVVLARLIRPQGRKGEILADLLTDFPERFGERKNVFLSSSAHLANAAEPRPIEVETHWLHKGRIVLKFRGIDSINDAELLRGMEVVTPREERTPLADDEVYVDDLLDCMIYDGSGNSRKGSALAAGELFLIGKVADVDTESTAGALLVVELANGEEALIPFVKAYLLRVDVAAKRIEMNLPEGLLEVNAPLNHDERALEAASEREPTKE